MSVVMIQDLASLREYIPAWAELAGATSEANVFYEHWMLLPAFEAFAADRDVRIVMLFSDERSSSMPGSPVLCGVFPLERIAPGVLSFWRYAHCYLCTPLIRAGYTRACIEALFDWLATDRQGSILLACPSIPEQSPFYESLVGYLDEQRTLPFIWRRNARPILRPLADSARYFDKVLSARKRRKLRSQERHLAAEGSLEYVALDSSGDIEAWLREFLRLEASGWKGRNGTAFQCTEAGKKFFEVAVTEAFHQGRLMMLALRLNGRDIAQLCNFLCKDSSFAFKVAFDEAYARYSPGVLLELENIRQVHQLSGKISWMDSCTWSPESPVQYLWWEERILQTALITTAKWPGRWVRHLLPLLKVVAPRNHSAGALRSAP
jgi:CelD/BcsL family acetyltransferase involved in cellulose biosynthesis